ncbi:9846_t:CDS:2 [Paraglomus occultum]|uniref:9846_t:CDS:1 n=1 Tax=Paraglomus occultum TaxID=144539 RepID=A0A9N9C4X3_9GLOM|nr:9846_t:CDS:2 [Paraglomus occultum]
MPVPKEDHPAKIPADNLDDHVFTAREGVTVGASKFALLLSRPIVVGNVRFTDVSQDGDLAVDHQTQQTERHQMIPAILRLKRVDWMYSVM